MPRCSPGWISPFVHTLLLMSGGVIPASKYKFSTCVGFRHPVIARHDLFSLGSSICACADLTHTPVADSARLSSIKPLLF